MIKKIKKRFNKECLNKAFRTAVQTAAGVALANITLLTWTGSASTYKEALVSFVTIVGASVVAALMNMGKELVEDTLEDLAEGDEENE